MLGKEKINLVLEDLSRFLRIYSYPSIYEVLGYYIVQLKANALVYNNKTLLSLQKKFSQDNFKAYAMDIKTINMLWDERFADVINKEILESLALFFNIAPDHTQALYLLNQLIQNTQEIQEPLILEKVSTILSIDIANPKVFYAPDNKTISPFENLWRILTKQEVKSLIISEESLIFSAREKELKECYSILSTLCLGTHECLSQLYQENQEQLILIVRAILRSWYQMETADDKWKVELIDSSKKNYDLSANKTYQLLELQHLEKILKQEKFQCITTLTEELGDAYCKAADLYQKLGYIDQHLEYLKQLNIILNCTGGLEKAQYYGIETPKYREIILIHSVPTLNLLEIRSKLLDQGLLNTIVTLAKSGKWFSKKLPYCLSFLKYAGINDYLEADYIVNQLGEDLHSVANIDLARILLFEVMNIGIMNSEKPQIALTCAENFALSYPNLIHIISKEYPNFFIDGSIIDACKKVVDFDIDIDRVKLTIKEDPIIVFENTYCDENLSVEEKKSPIKNTPSVDGGLKQNQTSLIDNQYTISALNWVISIVGKDNEILNRGKDVFLILEGKNKDISATTVLYRIEFIQQSDREILGKIIMNQININNEELENCFQQLLGNFGNMNKLQNGKHYCAKSSQINVGQVDKLLEEIKQEKSKPPMYNSLKDIIANTALQNDFINLHIPNLVEESHNCYTWAREKLFRYLDKEEFEKLKLTTWQDFIDSNFTRRLSDNLCK